MSSSNGRSPTESSSRRARSKWPWRQRWRISGLRSAVEEVAGMGGTLGLRAESFSVFLKEDWGLLGLGERLRDLDPVGFEGRRKRLSVRRVLGGLLLGTAISGGGCVHGSLGFLE